MAGDMSITRHVTLCETLKYLNTHIAPIIVLQEFECKKHHGLLSVSSLTLHMKVLNSNSDELIMLRRHLVLRKSCPFSLKLYDYCFGDPKRPKPTNIRLLLAQMGLLAQQWCAAAEHIK